MVMTTRRRRHGWQLPLQPLQLLGMALFALLLPIGVFYIILIWSKVARNTLLALFSFSAFSAAFMYIRCTAVDPSDRLKKKSTTTKRFLLWRCLLALLTTIESRIRSIRRHPPLHPHHLHLNLNEPMLPFAFSRLDDIVSPLKHYHFNQDNLGLSFCPICDCQVKLRSKHCMTCHRCVDGFDHHCRWLNNCIGKRNYASFILLLLFLLFMLVIEGGTAMAIFVRCFVDSKALKMEMEHTLHICLPKGLLAALSMAFFIFTLYCTAALGQLFFFHVVLIRKGMRTYDYILAMREEGQQAFDPFDDSHSSSDESIDFDNSPEKPSFISRILCRNNEVSQSARKLSILIEKEPNAGTTKKDDIQINPLTLIKMSKDKAMAAAERARERIQQKLRSSSTTTSPMKPLPVETKQGPLMNQEKRHIATGKEIVPVFTKSWLSGSPTGRFSSPRRRFPASPSPKPQRYRSNFDLKLTEVSRELETHISKQVLCSVIMKGIEDEACSS